MAEVSFSIAQLFEKQFGYKSDAFNFSKEDAVNDAEFNEVIWKGIKGINSTVPSPRRAAFVRVIEDED